MLQFNLHLEPLETGVETQKLSALVITEVGSGHAAAISKNLNTDYQKAQIMNKCLNLFLEKKITFLQIMTTKIPLGVNKVRGLCETGTCSMLECQTNNLKQLRRR